MSNAARHDPIPILAALRLEPLGEGRFRAGNVTMGEGHENLRTVVFGGQLLGQAMAAAAAAVPGKRVLSVQIVFSRAAGTERELELAVEVVHDGRALATARVDFAQGGRPACTALVGLDAGEEDLIRHAEPMPAVPGPAESPAVEWAEPGSEVRVVGGVDLAAAAAGEAPEAHVWARFPGAPAEPLARQALAAWYTDMFVMGAAMRPHEGVGFEVAHTKVSTGVFAHTLVFHEPCDVRSWFLVSQRSTYAGRGRYHGHGGLYTEEGKLFASFSQTGVVRAMPGHYGDRPDGSRVM